MAQKVYVGVNNKARQVKKIYIGINNIAKKIKKAYIGIGGVARPCFSLNNGPVYYGTLYDRFLHSNGIEMAATTVGNYAIFAGGYDSYYDEENDEHVYSYYSATTAFNASLTQFKPSELSNARSYFAATTVGNYALFGGGENNYWSKQDEYGYSSVVDAYNESLTRSNPTSLQYARGHLAATTVGNYALFGGGYDYSDSYNRFSIAESVDAYNTSLTRSTATVLYDGRYNLSATTVGSYAIFSCGKDTNASDYTTRVDVYNTSLTRSSSSMTPARALLAATTVGNYALFGGGLGTDRVATVNVFDNSLTKTTADALSQKRNSLAATTVGNYALFAGGVYNDSVDYVDIYDDSLTHTIATQLSTSRCSFAATTVGKYAIFGGGEHWEVGDGEVYYLNSIEVYTLVS